MKRFATPKTEEFEARQSCFDFGMVARAVLSIAVSVKETLSTWWKAVTPTQKKKNGPKPVQFPLFALATS